MPTTPGTAARNECLLCRGPMGDAELLRVQVWGDDLWRLSTTLLGEVAGFSYLEPRRHVRYVDELDGAEAATFGAVLARCTNALKSVTGAELVYVYIFGGSFDHLHLHLAPYHRGGPLNDCMIKGDVEEHTLDSGAVVLTSKDHPLRPESEMREVAERLTSKLAPAASPRNLALKALINWMLPRGRPRPAWPAPRRARAPA